MTVWFCLYGSLLPCTAEQFVVLKQKFKKKKKGITDVSKTLRLLTVANNDEKF